MCVAIVNSCMSELETRFSLRSYSLYITHSYSSYPFKVFFSFKYLLKDGRNMLLTKLHIYIRSYICMGKIT